MVHNAVVYGLMQAYAEGYELLATETMEVDVDAALHAWAAASVSRSFLLDRVVEALEQDPGFASVEPWVDDTGMGRWSVIDGARLGIPTPVLTSALYARFLSRQESPPAMRVLASLRRVVGGHRVKARG
jgi:6-phosphogluconate dehydrogenase